MSEGMKIVNNKILPCVNQAEAVYKKTNSMKAYFKLIQADLEFVDQLLDRLLVDIIEIRRYFEKKLEEQGHEKV